jgi:hypothetical protein
LRPRPLRLDREKKAIAAPHDGLQNAPPEDVPHGTDVSSEKALTDGELPPYRADEFLSGQEALRMRGQVSQYLKRLPP